MTTLPHISDERQSPRTNSSGQSILDEGKTESNNTNSTIKAHEVFNGTDERPLGFSSSQQDEVGNRWEGSSSDPRCEIKNQVFAHGMHSWVDDFAQFVKNLLEEILSSAIQRTQSLALAQTHNVDEESDSDDSELYIRKRLPLINAEFAKEPLPPETEEGHNRRVSFIPQLVDLVAPSPSNSVEAIDELSEKRTALGVSESCELQHMSVIEKRRMFGSGDTHAEQGLQEIKVQTPLFFADIHHPLDSNEDDRRKGKALKGQMNEQKSGFRPNSHGDTVMGNSGLEKPFRRSERTEVPERSNCLYPERRQIQSQSTANQSRPVSGQSASRASKRLKTRESYSAKAHTTESNQSGSHRGTTAQTVSAWIKQKNREERERRRAEAEKQAKEEEKRKEKEAADKEAREKQFSAWLRSKSLQLRQEQQLKQKQEAEKSYFTVEHSREQCEQAFKRWLQKKAQEHQQRVRDARKRLRLTRQLILRNRREQVLSQVIEQAGVYRLLNCREIIQS
ncbi:unnamed protein product [Calicophoron daubneyi]|uniref:Coiled-coil domain-containing protein 181 n=1 Tax=Calicophoron daubneyi TaxID=300641 RepID=A0AAV2TF02_CALDB